MNKIAEKGTEGGEKNASSVRSEDAMGSRDEEEAREREMAERPFQINRDRYGVTDRYGRY